MIKCIYFDLDGTLYDFKQVDRLANIEVKRYILPILGISEEEYDAGVQQTWDEIACRLGTNAAAVHNREIRYQHFIAKYGLKYYPYSGDMHRIYWKTLLENMEPAPGIEKLLKALKEKGFKLGIGSNMTSYIQYMKMERLELADYFDYFVSSEDAGFEKPDRHFFEFCASEAGVKLEECAFIGDTKKLDVDGSTAAGMKGIYYAPGKNEPGAIDTYEDLNAVIKLL